MSANLDLVRSIYADWEHGDFSSLKWADPKIEYTVVGGPMAGSWIGVAAMTDITREHISALEGFHIAVDECRELDGERVLLLWSFRGRAKASGIDAAEIPGATGAYLFDIRRGKVMKLTYYTSCDRAFADLGLKE